MNKKNSKNILIVGTSLYGCILAYQLSKNKKNYKMSSPNNKDRSKLAYQVEESSMDTSCKFQTITLLIETYVRYFLLTINYFILQIYKFLLKLASKIFIFLKYQ